jgi:hypothetical protein
LLTQLHLNKQIDRPGLRSCGLPSSHAASSCPSQSTEAVVLRVPSLLTARAGTICPFARLANNPIAAPTRAASSGLPQLAHSNTAKPPQLAPPTVGTAQGKNTPCLTERRLSSCTSWESSHHLALAGVSITTLPSSRDSRRNQLMVDGSCSFARRWPHSCVCQDHQTATSSAAIPEYQPPW